MMTPRKHYRLDVHGEDENLFFVHHIEPEGPSYQYAHNPETNLADYCDCEAFWMTVRPKREKVREEATSAKDYLKKIKGIKGCPHEILVMQFNELKAMILENCERLWDKNVHAIKPSTINTLHNEIIKTHQGMQFEAAAYNHPEFVKCFIEAVTKNMKNNNGGNLPPGWALNQPKILKNNSMTVAEGFEATIRERKKEIQRTLDEAFGFMAMHESTDPKETLTIFLSESAALEEVKNTIRFVTLGVSPNNQFFSLMHLEACKKLGGKPSEMVDFL
jgi:hypothetical protein